METRTRNWLVGIGSGLLFAALSLYLFATYFNWNSLRAPIERRVTVATGRTFSISGNIDVRFHWHPIIMMDGVSLGNASWGTTPLMAQIGHAEITLDVFSLFHKEVIIPVLAMDHANLVLEKRSATVANWQFDTHSDDSHHSNRSVVIHQLIVNDASVHYLSAVEHADLVITASTVKDEMVPHTAESRMLKIKAHGSYQQLPLSLQGKIGIIDNAADLQSAYPLSLEGSVGSTYVNASGTVAEISQLQGLDLHFGLAGASLADLFPLLGVPLPPSPPYSFGGRLLQKGGVWNFQNFSGKLGNSDLHGQFMVNRALKPQFISADLQSENLDLKDLSGFVGGRNDSGKPIVNSKTVLPQQTFNFEKLHAADAAVTFHGKNIQTQRLPLEDMSAVLKLTAGVLALEPLSFGVAQGHMDASIRINANHDPIESTADIKVRHVQFGELFPQFKFKQANAGIIGGRAKLTGDGNSIAAMLGTANGQAALLMKGGSVSDLVIQLANLDVAHSILLLVGGDKSVPVRCLVADMTAEDGKMTTNTLLLDTQKSLLEGQGSINFADETLNLSLAAHPKDKSVLALKGPIEVSGTFKHPSAAPSAKNVVGRAALAATLGSIAGPLALVPLLELGGEKNADCAGLEADLRSRFDIKSPAQSQ